ncbi:MAG TPA: hypothetical protein VK495_06260 [Steroidobacteraceae bacterium]|nr:hypothetical protein [Steroidobacteraceae bacterium]
MSVAKNLVAGRILEDQLFPYIDSGSEDYSVEAAISKVFASEALQRSAYEALQDLGKSKIFTPMPQLLRGRRVFMKSTPLNWQRRRISCCASTENQSRTGSMR